MNNESKKVENYALQMTNTALQEFFNDDNVRLSINFSDDGKVKKVVAEKRPEGYIDKETKTIFPNNTEEKNEDQNITECDMMNVVTNLLHKIGIPAHLSGYEYVRTAIILTIEKPELLKKGITKELYPKVATKHLKTDSQVERCIRTAIGFAWENGNIEFIEELFGYTVSYNKGKPTNVQFIALVSDYLKIRLNL